MSPILYVNLTLFVIPRKLFGNIDLQCCNYCHLLSDYHPNFMKVFDYIKITIAKYTILKVDELKVSWNDNTCTLIHKKHH